MGHLVIQKKQTQTNPIKAKTNPIQTQFTERAKLMQSVYLQRIKKKNADMGQKNKAKTKPKQTQLLAPLSRVLYTLEFSQQRLRSKTNE